MGVLALLAALAAFFSGTAASQAPQSADMWRVATATLAAPAALGRGPTSTFWNPARTAGDARLAAGIQVVQTPDVIGLAGVLLAASHRLGRHFQVAGLVGRVEIRDLLRTTTSPLTTEGDIPAYEQLGGVSFGALAGPAAAAVTVRAHNARFDRVTDGGLTIDLGFRLTPWRRLTVAGATHLLPIDLSARNTTDYYAAAEYLITAAPVFGARARLVGRYGLTYRDRGGVDHGFGLGLTLDEAFTLDGIWMRESAYSEHEGRLALAVGLRVGHYAITIARGGGLNDLGPTYRLGLDVDILR